MLIKDLEVSNIIMTASNEHGVPRIANIKNAVVLGPEGQTTGILGDINFRAPEVLQGLPYSYKADSWSVGVILYYILTLELPFTDRRDIIEGSPDIKRLKDTGYSENVCNLLGKLLQNDVTRRLKMGISL
jgi:NIMA (never in mitosis gene a)-related kinase